MGEEEAGRRGQSGRRAASSTFASYVGGTSSVRHRLTVRSCSESPLRRAIEGERRVHADARYTITLHMPLPIVVILLVPFVDSLAARYC